MSYYWGSVWNCPSSGSTGIPSCLHQERSYLLAALASEETRIQQLTQSLEAARAKLKAAQEAQEPAATDLAVTLKKAAAGLARKIKRSQRNEKAMVKNLAAVTARMGTLQQHQWRRAYYEYNQRAQFFGMGGLGMMDMQGGLNVAPHEAAPTLNYYPEMPFRPVMPRLVPTQMPPTPVIQPQSAITFDDPWGPTLDTSVYGQSRQHHFWAQALADLDAVSPLTQGPRSSRGVAGSPWNFEPAQQERKARSMSLPAASSGKASAGAGSSCGIGEQDDEGGPKKGMGLGYRLSLVDYTGAGIRLKEKVM